MKQLSREEKVEKWLHWKNNPLDFIQECVYIQEVGGDTPLQLYDCQKRVLESFYKDHYNILLKSRQTGFSTLFRSIICHLAIFYDNVEMGILSRSGGEASLFNSRVISSLDVINEKFPWLHPGYEFCNKQSFKLSNGSGLHSAAVAYSNPENVFRGESLNLLIVDEAAFIKYIDEAWTSVIPALSKVQQVARDKNLPFGTVILSTPNRKSGTGKWYFSKWTDSINNPDGMWKAHRIHWSEIDSYRNDPDWYKHQCELLENNQAKIQQELELQFIDSENSLFSSDVQMKLNNVRDQYISKLRLDGGELSIYKKINAEKFYLIGVDTASASGSDFSTVQIVDYETMEQAAEYKGKLEPIKFAEVVKKINEIFPKNLIIVENTGGYGLTVLNLLEYDEEKSYNLFGEIKGEGKNKKTINGLSTNSKTRPLILESLFNYINDDVNCIKSEKLALELLSLTNKENKIQADDGFHDDLAMAFGFCCYVRKYSNDAIKFADYHKEEELSGDDCNEMINSFYEDIIKPDNYYTAISRPLPKEQKEDETIIDFFKDKMDKEEEDFYDRIFANG